MSEIDVAHDWYIDRSPLSYSDFFKSPATSNYWTDLHPLCISFVAPGVSSFTENTRDISILGIVGENIVLLHPPAQYNSMNSTMKTWVILAARSYTQSWDNMRVLGESSWPCEYGKIPADSLHDAKWVDNWPLSSASSAEKVFCFHVSRVHMSNEFLLERDPIIREVRIGCYNGSIIKLVCYILCTIVIFL